MNKQLEAVARAIHTKLYPHGLCSYSELHEGQMDKVMCDEAANSAWNAVINELIDMDWPDSDTIDYLTCAENGKAMLQLMIEK